MNEYITSEMVAVQLSRAIKLLLDWAEQGHQRNQTPPAKVESPARKAPEIEPLLKASDVSKILNISRSTAYQLMKKNEIPTVKFGGNTIRVRLKDLEKFINNRGLYDAPEV